jgi:hypothetical protein
MENTTEHFMAGADFPQDVTKAWNPLIPKHLEYNTT